MQFSIIELNPHSIIVGAPLQSNINIHGTGFAGSLYSVGILTGWALSTHIMSLHDMAGGLVVGKADIKYRSPVTGDFVCRAMVSEADSPNAVLIQGTDQNGAKLRLISTISIPMRYFDN